MCNQVSDIGSILSIRKLFGKKKYKLFSWSEENVYPLETIQVTSMIDGLRLQFPKAVKQLPVLNNEDIKNVFVRGFDPVNEAVSWEVNSRHGEIKLGESSKRKFYGPVKIKFSHENPLNVARFEVRQGVKDDWKKIYVEIESTIELEMRIIIFS
jgi:hypothetical protein